MNVQRVKEVVFSGLSFLANHLFIATTGTAALVHSTWSLAVAFNGPEPSQGTWAWWFWVIPALLLAISIDIGQIATSAQIANGQRTRSKYGTFAVLAIATYYLQWLYLVHHLPLIALGPGVNEQVAPFATGVRDIALWVLPGLLPISTLLYTFSYGSVRRQRKETMTIRTQTEVKIEKPVTDMTQIEAPAEPVALLFPISCPDCDWSATKVTRRSASNALVAHRKAKHPAKLIGGGR